MHISREYVAYLSRELTRRLIDREMISTANVPAATELVRHAMDEEFSVESRINEEARAILALHEAELQRLGASYSEAFKKVKAELVRKHKVVL